ncbi:CLUMA_CG015009, isoform A [Clunio marinus]|uniref:CLUMA_CG015009, isoform A n=1 Tax=Clunio marinus TaxID=568069 RepID=A0A1J1ITF8_9DIPT|nr:CLUMA_CG015009, isoform A [Clunio marinus]
MESNDKSDEDKAADAREARRRRILENSNKRLGKITGREHNEEITVAEPIMNGVYPDPEMERDVYEAPMLVAGIDPDQDIFEMLKTMQGGGNPQFSRASQQQHPSPVPETFLSKFIRSKFPIVLISLAVYMIFTFNMEFLVGGAVFSSLIIWEIFEFIMTTFIIKQPTQPTGIISILFAFGGINQEKAEIIMKLLGLFNKILRDVAIFLFTFVMIHLAWSFFVAGENLTEILDKDFSNLLRNDEL